MWIGPGLYCIHVLCCENNRSHIETSLSLGARTEQRSEKLTHTGRTEANLQSSFCNLSKKYFCCFASHWISWGCLSLLQKLIYLSSTCLVLPWLNNSVLKLSIDKLLITCSLSEFHNPKRADGFGETGIRAGDLPLSQHEFKDSSARTSRNNWKAICRSWKWCRKSY